MRLVAAPRIEASGVRKSWLIEAKQRVADALGLGRGAGGVHLLGEPGALERGPRLVAGAAGDRGGENGHREQDEKRQKLVRLGDREGVQRLDEEEVVG